MRKTGWRASLFLSLLLSLFFIALSGTVFAEAPAAVVQQLQKQRQAFAQDNQIDLQRLSQEIGTTVRDTAAFDQAGNDAEAIARLQTLSKYAPLPQFPSLDVQVLCERIYTKLSQANDAAGCHERAMAMADILQHQSGSGASPDDPVRVITINEIAEWARSQAAKISEVHPYTYHDANLQAITYAGPSTAGKPTVAYFQFAPRLVTAISNKTSDVFAPLPVSPGDGRYQTALTQAHEQRVNFLNDVSFNYLELIRLCDNIDREAMRLAQQGDFQGALSKFSDVEKIRPIQQIPIFGFISTYSFLLGKAGHADAQSAARLYLFGISQDIAHSGDGLAPESAIHVIAISEEYAWASAKKLRVTKQSLLTQGDHRYDAIDMADEGGATHTYYFEVSQLYARESAALK